MTGNGRVNEILLESQKLIYAPPSRGGENVNNKYKPSYRSPLIEK